MRHRRKGAFAHAASAVLALGLAAAASCASPERDGTVETKVAAIGVDTPAAIPGDLDVLFMIDDSSGMASMQTKLAVQIPSFIDSLQNLPNGIPNVHVAVVSSDLGAPGDSTSVTCTTSGDQGLFRLSPSCTSSTLAAGETFISNVGGVANYTGSLADVLACITPLGETGCGFGHQLGSIARALGADGAPAPARNAGFLRPEADLAIIILSDADDCSAPPTTDLYSLNGGKNNVKNALGPMAHYRCNEFGHWCVDPSGDPQTSIQPPVTPPTDAQGTPTAPTLTLNDCESLDYDGLLTPVSTLVSGIKALKPDLSHQVFVSAIVAPAAPYTVDWVPAVGGQSLSPGELWPQIEHSCGGLGGVNSLGQVATDGSWGDPAVRIAQWVKGFGDNGVVTSVCDADYASAFSAIAAKIAAHLPGGNVTTTGTGGSGVVGAGDAGTTLADAGGLGATGAGGTSKILGADGSTQVGVNGQRGTSGLRHGGCDVGASGSGASGLVLAGLFLLGARRRRGSTGGPGAES